MADPQYLEHGAFVAGPAAFLLSRAHKAPVVAAFFARARWFHGVDVQLALDAIDRAGRAWERSLHLEQRGNAEPVNADTPESGVGWSVERSANHLGLSIRRVQELAQSGVLDGRRIGRRWVLDQSSVRAYRQRRKGVA